MLQAAIERDTPAEAEIVSASAASGIDVGLEYDKPNWK